MGFLVEEERAWWTAVGTCYGQYKVFNEGMFRQHCATSQLDKKIENDNRDVALTYTYPSTTNQNRPIAAFACLDSSIPWSKNRSEPLA